MATNGSSNGSGGVTIITANSGTSSEQGIHER
eukprot:CAMPEP_0201585782 /NCGR_PEP_ID=MMETSP0190_2-20130828/125480_1 /ASSEMBLY_ACC=CAM_ASM_000263 /TAXON_ID=37353 /ORGANISM="Rosalina sp." /LENGTH=31 /DNA_ID= /DNA_START= /DNA_END= /DNA_ORIENTATION=